MEYEIEITERLRNAVMEALKKEMMLGWSLDQLIPMLHNAIDDALYEMEE